MKLHRALLPLAALCLAAVTSIAQIRSQVIQSSALEAFLSDNKAAKVSLPKRKEDQDPLKKGVVDEDAKIEIKLDGESHYAMFKWIDVGPMTKDFGDGNREFNFQDTWKTEIAAYEVDKIIGLGMVPATVQRKWAEHTGSAQFWVDKEMREGERREKNIQPPNATRWDDQWQKMKLFDNLIYNADRNVGNILITKAWEIILIDHSRSFRNNGWLNDPKGPTRFSRSLLEGLRRLNEANLKEKTGKYLSKDQQKNVLKRRDLILDLANKAVAERGEQAVLYP